MYKKTFLGRASSEIDSDDIQDEYQQIIDNESIYQQYYQNSNASQYIEEESFSKQSVNIQLLHQNLKNYGTMRGLHSQIDISTLKRLNQSSYVEFDDQQKYKMNYDINRIYKGVPKNTIIQDQEYETKTIFHEYLYSLEDQLHDIDVEILQLKFLLKKTEKMLNSFNAYKSFIIQQKFNFISIIDSQILQLKNKRKALQNIIQQEDGLHQLSNDQQYYNKISYENEKLSSRFITSFYLSKQNQILTNVSQAFTINFLNFQPNWLKQLELQYTQLQLKQSLLIPPIQIFHFPNQTALSYSFLLLNLIFQKKHQNQHNIWMTTLFKDFFQASFEIEEDQLQQLNFKFHRQNNCSLFDSYFNYIMQNVKNEKIICQNQELKLIDPQLEQIDFKNQQAPLKQKDKLNFFPDLQDIQILYGEMILLEIFHLLFNLYLRAYRIIYLQEVQEYQGEQIKLNELLPYLLIKQLEDKIKDYQIYTFLKNCFIEQQAIQFQGIFAILAKFKKVFLKLDENSKELLLIYTQRQLGNKSQVKIQDAKQNLLTIPDNILRKINYESQQKQLCRLQITKNLVFIHRFILQDTIL
ncbi:unnamed protein product [Paramecium sonneborni]|uniref:Uncharacterized protein n=1 Tax=Paramecium sonneborni TaxID=65129 RepID=A0A8S1PD10_9CILI|nr:unnamed protein product [Paramecium sonneborni]